MIGRVTMLAIMIAGGCTKPSSTPPPRRVSGEAVEPGWSIDGVVPANEDDAGDDADAPVPSDEAARDDPTATTRADDAPANADAGASEGPDASARPREPALTARTPIVPVDHPHHGRLEGEGLANACKRDGECVTGGCAREVCSAQQGVTTTCELLTVQLPTDAACGCVAGECVWYSRNGATLPVPKRDGPQPNVGEAPGKKTLVHCGGAVCKPGQKCIEYFGIAGPSGPRFESCEWPCGKGQRCPKGTSCTTVADGPGRVCR